MALKPCRECGNNVSTSAEICPHCGVRAPASSDVLAAIAEPAAPNSLKKQKGCGPTLLVFGLIVVALYALGSNDGGSSKSGQSKQAKPETGCRHDWHRCSDNGDFVENSGRWVDVQVGCKIEAENRARYGSPKWPWLAFSSYIPGSDYIKTGRVIAVEKDAQFQNGFGAMVHSRVVCHYDLNTGKVADIAILER